MKSINLISLANALLSDISDEYVKYIDIKPKDTEKKSFIKLCQKFLDLQIPIYSLNDFFFGYNIPQIGKEFDLLRIGNNYNLNIEIKSVSTEEKITKQLKLNRWYLSSLNTPIQLYSYISDTDVFYTLDSNDNLITVAPENIKQSILEQDARSLDTLDFLFEPSQYLVSPFNATSDFMADHYFLSPQQANVEQELDSILKDSTANIIAIEGEAGTGKSLLLYDYAKKIIQRGEQPLIVHVAKLNQGHMNLMQEYRFSICEIKDFMKILDKLNNFDVVLIDEAQRLKTNQLNKIIDYIQSNKINCIFGYDEKQKLSQQEYANGSVEIIESKSVKKYNLTHKIRTNKNLVAFTKSMFDTKNGKVGNLSNVSLVYFNNQQADVLNYITHKEDYKFIRYTPSIFSTIRGQLRQFETPHEVIGQEFDNVVVYIGANFCYNEEGLLQAANIDGNPYDFLGMLYQAITRARKKLEIVIIDNPNVFKTLSNILT